MDLIDLKILEELQKDGRRTQTDLAKDVRLSPPSVLERVRKLEELGIIKKFVAIVDAAKVGNGIEAFVNVKLRNVKDEQAFLNEIYNLDEVLECHKVTGEYSYILKVKTRDTVELGNLISSKIKSVDGVDSTFTNVVLKCIKEETKVSLKNFQLASGRSRKESPAKKSE